MSRLRWDLVLTQLQICPDYESRISSETWTIWWHMKLILDYVYRFSFLEHDIILHSNYLGLRCSFQLLDMCLILYAWCLRLWYPFQPRSL
jgi:hypothetical protein